MKRTQNVGALAILIGDNNSHADDRGHLWMSNAEHVSVAQANLE